MTDFAELLKALAALAWPVIVVIVLWAFKPAVASLIESAKSREFSLEIGGQKLSMKEANAQQRELIADLQGRVAELAKKVDGVGGTASRARDGPPAEPAALTSEKAGKVTSVLWVDDVPKNNSYFIEQFTKAGITVDLAKSTQEGEQLFRRKRYGIVLSDMSRVEDGVANPDAGVDLVDAIRAHDAKVPIIIFCSRIAAARFGAKALEHGATGVSSSSAELYALLNLDAIKDKSA